jgi:oligoribonuclease NrnB/cAMP/cGMP phosphodiesterase (DHH superfamily)
MENNKQFDTIVYHSCCPDGVTGLWCAYKYKEFKDFEKIKMSAGKDPSFDTNDKNIIFIDVCPSMNFILVHSKLAKSIKILDHHKSANDMYLKNESMLNNIDNIEFIFDMNRAGCQIAWDYFFPNIERVWFIDYVGDRDLWKWELENSKEICSAFDYLCVLDENNLKKIDKLAKYNLTQIENLVSTGKIINAYQKTLIKKEVENSIQGFLYVGKKKYNVNIGNIIFSLVSDLGNALSEKILANGNKPDFAVVWNYNLFYDTWHISLRGHDASPDLSEIAKYFGGGGHAKASGFKIIGAENIKKLFRY